MKQFFEKHKVLIFGLLSAIALSAHELIMRGEDANTKVLVYAGIVAGLTFLSKNLRGQWISIAGLVLTSFSTYVQMEEAGDIQWRTIIIQAIVAFLAIVSPPPKSRGYEHTMTVENARKQGEQMQPTTLGKK